MFAVYFLLLVLPLVSAQVEVQGPCRVPHPQQNFNLHKVLGLWYEIARIPSPLNGGSCITLEYQMPKGNSYGIGQYTRLLNGKWSSASLAATVTDSREPAQLVVQPPGQPDRIFWVLSTDYNSYAVLYTCKDHNSSHLQFAWILSRMPYLDQKTLDEAKGVLLNQGIYGNMMEHTDQSCYIKTHRKY